MKTTPLHSAHTALGAKMGEFAGYDMPLYYGEGVMKEHEWTRSKTGLFDVSHMGQVMMTGPGVIKFLEHVTPTAFNNIPDGRARYSVMPNEQGGIVDDLIITRLGPEKFFTVINAGCKDKDIAWLKSHLTPDIKMDVWTDRALIALQGPEAENALRDVLGIDAADMPYMWGMPVGDLMVSRLGYTGEDGFEISVPENKALEMWNKFLAHSSVKPVGLAARDSLRLEMGYPLYGHDIDAETSPVEAALNWIIAKDHTDYIGAKTIVPHLQGGTKRQRVGIRLTDKGVAREGAEIRNQQDQVIGKMTSGGFSPTLKQSVGQGYVETRYAVPGEKIFVNVRGSNIAAEIAPLSHVPAKTKSMKKESSLKEIKMADLKFTKDHEWLKVEGDVAVIGITDYAQNALGDLVYIELPKMGKQVKKGEHFAVVESVKTAAEVYTPVTGEVVAINDNLSGDPELLKKGLDEGWIAKIKMTSADEMGGLMDQSAYDAFVKTLD
jgi:aminomethyltransferase